jgi:hypothetical protein
MTDRFDLEQHIMKCWNIVDDLTLLRKSILDKQLTTDEITNYVLGLETMYNLKFDELFETFSTLIQQGDIK